MICRLLVAAVSFLVLGAAQAQAQGQGYGQGQGQDTYKLFELEQTTVDKAAARALALQLVEFAQTQAAESSEFYYIGEYRKLVRLAYQLAPDEPAVAAAHSRIKEGLPPLPPNKKEGRENLMISLTDLLAKAQSGVATEDQNLACYLSAAGVLVDQKNLAIAAQFEKFGRGQDRLWEPALAVYRRNVADGTVAVINGLAVTSTGLAEVGRASRILLTYRMAQAFGPGLNVRLIREKGVQMNTSAEEAVRYWQRVRAHVPLPHGMIELSFEDKFEQKEGPSAGLAYAVLLRSFSDPFPIDSAVAITGDVSVEGRVLAVGSPFAKIRGAKNGGCKRVGIPTQCETELMDSLVLYGSATMAEIEVIGLESVDEAIALCRQDRDEKSRKASEAFAELALLVDQKTKGADPGLTSAIQKQAAIILALNPRHLSAKVIDQWNNRTLPTRLSLGASLTAANDVLYSYLLIIRRGPQPNLRDVANETKTTNINAAVDKLRALLPRLHLDVQKPADMIEKSLVSLQRYVYLRGDLEKKAKKVEELDKAVKEAQKRLDRARSDRRPKDEIDSLQRKLNQAQSDLRDGQALYKRDSEDRDQFLNKSIEHYNDWVMQVRAMTQDPKLLEKLNQGR